VVARREVGRLALDPAALADDPRIDELLRAAGFEPAPNLIGTWVSPD
jgi:hypothetical protein